MKYLALSLPWTGSSPHQGVSNGSLSACHPTLVEQDLHLVWSKRKYERTGKKQHANFVGMWITSLHRNFKLSNAFKWTLRTLTCMSWARHHKGWNLSKEHKVACFILHSNNVFHIKETLFLNIWYSHLEVYELSILCTSLYSERCEVDNSLKFITISKWWNSLFLSSFKEQVLMRATAITVMQFS